MRPCGRLGSRWTGSSGVGAGELSQNEASVPGLRLVGWPCHRSCTAEEPALGTLSTAPNSQGATCQVCVAARCLLPGLQVWWRKWIRGATFPGQRELVERTGYPVRRLSGPAPDSKAPKVGGGAPAESPICKGLSTNATATHESPESSRPRGAPRS